MALDAMHIIIGIAVVVMSVISFLDPEEYMFLFQMCIRDRICMDDLETAEKIWKNMTYSTVVQIDDSMIGKLKKFGVRSMKMTDAAAEFKRVVSDRGLDISPLKKLLEDTVDEERIRRSPRDFCAASFSVTVRDGKGF